MDNFPKDLNPLEKETIVEFKESKPQMNNDVIIYNKEKKIGG